MIPNIVHGNNMAGLMRYLIGEGRANEHTNPHVVADSEGMLMEGYGGKVLTKADATPIARFVDFYHKEGNGPKEKHVEKSVWHVSLALAASEGNVSDETWEKIAHRFMEEMGFSGGVKADVRWVAINHGVSKNGNAHIHIAASRIRNDGTKVWFPRSGDFSLSQKACRRLEREFGLEVLTGAEKSMSLRWNSQTDLAHARRLEREITVRDELEIRVRGALGPASSEAEFVNNLRSQGVIIRPRYAKGDTRTVVGYSVALPTNKTGGVWMNFGGGKLSKDLTLTRIRSRFNAPDSEQQEANNAAWSAAASNDKKILISGRTLVRNLDRIEAAYKSGNMNLIHDGSIPLERVLGDKTASMSGMWSLLDKNLGNDLRALYRESTRIARSSTRFTTASSSSNTLDPYNMVLLAARRSPRPRQLVASVAFAKALLRNVENLRALYAANGLEREARKLYEHARSFANKVENNPAQYATTPGVARIFAKSDKKRAHKKTSRKRIRETVPTRYKRNVNTNENISE